MADPAGKLAAASPNFGFLAGRDPLLIQAAAAAERYVFADPVTAIIKIRLFAEALARESAAHAGLYANSDEPQADLLRRLQDKGLVNRETGDFFHAIRKAGNQAVHENAGSQRDALYLLRVARSLAVWFQRAFVDASFKAGPFLPPPDPKKAEASLAEELKALRAALAKQEAEAGALRASAEQEALLRQQAESAARKAYEDLETAFSLAGETEAKMAASEAAFRAQLDDLQRGAAAATKLELTAVIASAQHAAEELDIDEAATRSRIDAQLREAGWEADTIALSFASGTRPTRGKNLAIAEWPTANGPADYVLFAGLTPLAVVEAKRKRKDVMGAIEQSKRYSRGFAVGPDQNAPGGPWGDYKIPFLFATNGRPFLRQLETKSGIWFLDARRAVNHPRPLDGWRTPEGLLALLSQDIAGADAKLKSETSDYLPLRDYQLAAITAVEAAVAEGRHEMLVAMATGTGKTRTALCLVYRLLKAKRFRRVLFLVDRTALGEQAQNAFKDVRLENLQALTEIYDVKGMGDIVPEPDTRLQVATIQGMVKRLLFPSEGESPVPVDQYDCIVVDECHRGYNLDAEMSEAELQFRSEEEYFSKYRRVLDHFDAVRIGLTATPALHTTEIFGPPIYQYSYRQAVIDGHLVDHEPPVRIVTRLGKDGIHWAVGEQVGVFNTASAQLELFETPDEIDIEIDGFNSMVITESFNRVVCTELARQIDPSDEGKTLVFCVTDAHADLVVDLLKKAFEAAYGEVEDDAVQKITGAADRPLQKIRHYKNERLPNVAVTVDLLTTGIDVPAISNLVFIRRVRSRILYEQMMGRATRLCPEINKEVFRIFDAVDLYAALKDHTQMTPVITRPNITFAQLVEELATVDDEEFRRSVLEQLTARLQQRRRRLKGKRLEAFETLAGLKPQELVEVLKKGPDAALAFFSAHAALVAYLDKAEVGEGRKIFVSQHDDEVVSTDHGYGNAARPEDYLEGFRRFLDENKNLIPALLVVTQRPKELTRQQLRELTLKLDEAGYNVTTLRTAWRETTNQDIAASIIGFIRQQALGSPLVSYSARVRRALDNVLASHEWTMPQRKWLERIGQQLEQEYVVDREALDRGQFQASGGFERLNKVFNGKLEQVLGEIHGGLWQDVG